MICPEEYKIYEKKCWCVSDQMRIESEQLLIVKLMISKVGLTVTEGTPKHVLSTLIDSPSISTSMRIKATGLGCWNNGWRYTQARVTNGTGYDWIDSPYLHVWRWVHNRLVVISIVGIDAWFRRRTGIPRNNMTRQGKWFQARSVRHQKSYFRIAE